LQKSLKDTLEEFEAPVNLIAERQYLTNPDKWLRILLEGGHRIAGRICFEGLIKALHQDPE
jgi:hypothetical protein